MPALSYDNDTNQVEPKPKLRLPHIKLGSVGRIIGIILVIAIVTLLSAFLAGLLSALSANITVTSVDLIFDPQITIAYILVFYFVYHFSGLSKSFMYWLFIFTLILSFTMNFIQGAITLVLLPPLLKKLHLVSEPER